MDPENKTEVPDTSAVIESKDTVGNSTLALDTSQIEQVSDVDPQQLVRPQIKVTPERMMEMLRTWLAEEKITPFQAKQMRAQYGILNNYFTKPKVDKEKNRHKKLIIKASRKANFKNGRKGQKSVAGYGK